MYVVNLFFSSFGKIKLHCRKEKENFENALANDYFNAS